jgi:hypothetical protein
MHTRRNHQNLIVAGALAAALTTFGCASTELTGTWTAPGVQGASLGRVAVIYMTKDPGLRRIAEDAAAAQLGPAATPSYQVLGDTDPRDALAVKEKLDALGFQGSLVMRLTNVSEQVSAVSGPYPTFVGYYGWAAPTVWGPAYLQTETIVHMVSNLYSLEHEGKLIWSGASKTFDPASAQSAVSGVAKAVGKQLKKEHLIVG